MTTPADEFAAILAAKLDTSTGGPSGDTDPPPPRVPQPNHAQGTSGGPLRAESPAAAFAQFLATSVGPRYADGGTWTDADTGEQVIVGGRWAPKS
jgi:hypothetical protein